jgi:hypothetical protein
MTALTRFRPALGVVIVAVAVLTLLQRLPHALGGLNATAKQNASYDALHRTLRLADSLDVDNGFVVEALQLPTPTTYAILPPSDANATKDGIPAETSFSLRGYFNYLLLPSRQVGPQDAKYFLCYACDARGYGGKVDWFWSEPGGFLIGRLKGSA